MMPNKSMNTKQRLSNKLKSIYFNAASPAGFSGKSKLKHILKGKVSPQSINKWLSRTDTYTLHKPIKKRFKRRKYVVSGINALWQCDLTELLQFAKYNNGYKYILLKIDVFSRKASAIQLKTKSASDVTNAFKDILKSENSFPDQLQTDKGKEFFNSKFQSMLSSYNIHHYASENQEIKASLVERLQRTLKSRLFRYFTHSNSYQWIDVLQDFIDSYNKTVHSSIGIKPIDISAKNQEEIWQRIYNPDNFSSANIIFKFSPGDKVRISKYSTVFAKGYTPLWSEEIFTVKERHYTDPPVYSLQDESGSKLKGTWYEQELQYVQTENNMYKIEAIVGKRKINGKIQYLVRWKGYPQSFDSYVDKKDMIGDYKN